MLSWIDSHGLEAIGILALIQLIAGTVPPLPANASWMAQWVYLFLKAVSFNARGIGNAFGIKTPEIQIANLPLGTKKESQ